MQHVPPRLWRCGQGRGYDLDGVQYSVEKIMSAETPRRIVGLPMTIKVPDDIPAEKRLSRGRRQVVSGCIEHPSRHRYVDNI